MLKFAARQEMDRLLRRSWNAIWNAAPRYPPFEPRVRKCLLSWLEELVPLLGGCLPSATSGSQLAALRGKFGNRQGAAGQRRNWELEPGQWGAPSAAACVGLPLGCPASE